MATPYLGQIKCFSFNFAPRGWAQCNGQLLPINQNQALFALLGTTYGGNGTINFALPDLRGRLPIGAGTGPQLTNRVLGEILGEENHTLTTTEMPAHTHTISACPREGDAASPLGNLPAKSGTGDARFGQIGQPGTAAMSASAVAPNVGGQPHSNTMPYISMNYCIALQGIFPSHP